MLVTLLLTLVIMQDIQNVDAMNERVHIDDIYLTPGGETIGIEVQTQVIVVDTYSVKGYSGYVNPASKVDIRKGDIILNIDGYRIDSIEDVKKQIDKYNDGHTNPLNIIVKRNGEFIRKKILPARTKEGMFSLGLYLKDNILGIGTLTFIYKDQYFGALGHQIQDKNDTVNDRMGDEGIIKKAVVTNIVKGTRGKPGEKKAAMDKEEIGTINENAITGIFGKMNDVSDYRIKKKLKIAPQEDVKLGDAKILTVIDNDKVEAFDVTIMEVKRQNSKDIKGLKIKITDDKLLDKTGGIIQGMSGSPIIQNGKIIGAVTHVLVDDQTIGYGVFIEFMLEEIGVNIIK